MEKSLNLWCSNSVFQLLVHIVLLFPMWRNRCIFLTNANTDFFCHVRLRYLWKFIFHGVGVPSCVKLKVKIQLLSNHTDVNVSQIIFNGTRWRFLRKKVTPATCHDGYPSPLTTPYPHKTSVNQVLRCLPFSDISHVQKPCVPVTVILILDDNAIFACDGMGYLHWAILSNCHCDNFIPALLPIPSHPKPWSLIRNKFSIRFLLL